MNVSRVFLLPVVMLLSACAQSPLWPKTANTLAVSSQPAGADVYLMGQAVGQTPLTLDLQTVFPATYEPRLVTHYGQLEFRKAGCQPLRLAVSTTHVERGINATLSCAHDAGSKPAQAPANTAPRTIKQRLLDLEQLRRDGLVDEAEYPVLRQRILDSL